MSKQSIWYVLPRGMRFDAERPTSIDLFVSEIVTNSTFDSTVYAEIGPTSLPSPRLEPLPSPVFASTLRRASWIAKAARRSKPELIVVQQHLPSAAAIARRVASPVVLQKHNFVRPPRPGALHAPGRAAHLRQFALLDGITFVSNAVRFDFEQHWGGVSVERVVIPNGLVVTRWSPATTRDDLVLAVGRASPDKGLVEAAEGVRAALAARPDWRCAFVLSETDRNAAYTQAVRSALASLGDRAELLENLSPARVRELNERAAIALVPSMWREPFGRTSLEAHAGGAAVVSSGTGGLRGISGPYALYLPDVTPDAIRAAVETLVEKPTLRAFLGEAGRRRVTAHFDLKSVARKMDDFIDGRLTARRRP